MQVPLIDYKTGWVFGFVLLVTLLSGCNFLGTKAISNGPASYNEALAITNDQQILAYIVRTRYGQSASLLAVASVTTIFKVRAAAGAQQDRLLTGELHSGGSWQWVSRSPKPDHRLQYTKPDINRMRTGGFPK